MFKANDESIGGRESLSPSSSLRTTLPNCENVSRRVRAMTTELLKGGGTAPSIFNIPETLIPANIAIFASSSVLYQSLVQTVLTTHRSRSCKRRHSVISTSPFCDWYCISRSFERLSDNASLSNYIMVNYYISIQTEACAKT